MDPSGPWPNTVETVEEYHQLVYSTFIMFGLMLKFLKIEQNSWKKEKAAKQVEHMTTMKSLFRQANLYTHLLLCILASSSFKHYMGFMTYVDISSLIPRFQDKGYYDKWWNERRCQWWQYYQQTTTAGASGIDELKDAKARHDVDDGKGAPGVDQSNNGEAVPDLIGKSNNYKAPHDVDDGKGAPGNDNDGTSTNQLATDSVELSDIDPEADVRTPSVINA